MRGKTFDERAQNHHSLDDVGLPEVASFGLGAGPLVPRNFALGLAIRSIMAALSLPRSSCQKSVATRGRETGCYLSRCPMTLMMGLGIAWSILTAVLVILLIYRSTLTMHEDDQLFLSDANSQMQQEQTELLVKVNRLRLPVWVVGAGSGVLLLVIGGMLIYQKLNEMQ